MTIRNASNIGKRRGPRGIVLLAALTLGSAVASAATFGPGSQLVATFTMKPNSADLLWFFDNDVPVITGSPTVTVSVYDGQTLLGTATSTPFVNGSAGSTFVVGFKASAAVAPGNAIIPFATINSGAINGRIVATINGGSVTNLNTSNIVIYDGKSTSGGFTILSDLTVTGLTLNPPVTSSLPHFVFGGGFVMDFYAFNNSDQPASFTINFYDDSGNPVSLPFITVGPTATLTDTLPARALHLHEAGTYSAALVEGSAIVTASPSVTIQALMRRQGSDGSFYEAAVAPAAGYKEFQIPFEATKFSATGDQMYTGFAIANLDPVNAAAITCTARDANGNSIANAVPVPALSPLGHWANASFPLLVGLRGTLDCTSTTTVGAIAIRAIGTNAISTLPVVPVH
ncbi:MAG TPA: hypothetical protein VKX45_21050 [Bryobacteraceae bacterium]|nr:hypothetical protein [Bryobacteraceae bacterium]